MNLSFSAVIPLGLLMKKPASLNYTLWSTCYAQKTFIIQSLIAKRKEHFHHKTPSAFQV